MENIKSFLFVSDGNGSGCGKGCGDGSGIGEGEGSGCGCGKGYGEGSVFGKGYGDGSGSGYGCGIGEGDGCGIGEGDGSGYGCGIGEGDGSGIKRFNGSDVHLIDNVQTIITHVFKNIAKGFILNSDLTLTDCYIAKGNNLFAHGETVEKAMEALQEKIFSNIDIDTAIEMFLDEFETDKKYPAKEFYVWHNRLTGSCEMGRKQFIKERGYNLETDSFTVSEFIEITKNSFGSEIIKQLEQALKERQRT